MSDKLDKQLKIAALLKKRDSNFNPDDHYLNLAGEILELLEKEKK